MWVWVCGRGLSANHCTLLYTMSCFPMSVVSIMQVDQMLRGAPVDSAGNFDYGAFTRILKHGTKDE